MNVLDPDVKGGMGGAKVVLVCSGGGLWVAVLVVMKYPEMVHEIIGIGSDSAAEFILSYGAKFNTKQIMICLARFIIQQTNLYALE